MRTMPNDYFVDDDDDKEDNDDENDDNDVDNLHTKLFTY